MRGKICHSSHLMSEVYLSEIEIYEDDYEQSDVIIGEGAFGTVYLGRMKANHKKFPNEQVAIKHLYKKMYESPQQTARNDQLLLREVVIPLRLPYPSIVPFIGLVRKPIDPKDRIILVTKFMPNGSLDKFIRNYHLPNDSKDTSDKYNHFTPTKISICIFGIAATMAKLHSKQIMHRDLKDLNVLLDENYEPVLADFGLSRDISSGNFEITNKIGSPFYMAPELFGYNDYSFPTDVYAFGIFVYNFFVPSSTFTFSNKVKPRSLNQISNNVKNSVRYMKPTCDIFTESYWNLIEDCWKQNDNERPSFQDIVKRLQRADFQHCVGTDVGELNEYQRRLLQALEDHPNTNLSKSGQRKYHPSPISMIVKKNT